MRGLVSGRAAGLSAAGWGSVLFLVYVIVILVHREPPSLGDFGDLTYQGVLLRNHMLGVADPLHVVKHYPVPNGAVTVGIALFALLLPWQMAAKAWLCTQIAISFFVMWHFVRSQALLGETAGWAMWCVAPTAIFFNLNFWYGFLNFELGVCWAVLIASMLLRGKRAHWSYQGLLLLGFFSHMVAFAFMGLMLVVYAAHKHAWRLLLHLVPTAVASAWYVYARFFVEGNADGQAALINAVKQFSAAFWAFKVNSYLKAFGWVNLGRNAGSATLHFLGERGFASLFVVNAVLCALLGWCMVSAASRAFRQRKESRFLWVAILLMLPLYVLAPGAALGISDPGFRILEVVAAVALLLCEASRQMQAAAVCAVVVAAVSVAMFVQIGYVVTPLNQTGGHLPRVMRQFAHVPNHYRDEYFEALRAGDMGLAVFPTGLLLNTAGARQASLRNS